MSPRTRNTVVIAVGILVLGLLPVGLYRVQTGGARAISPRAAKEMLISRPDAALLVDVRTPAEFGAGHLAAAVNWPLDEILGRTSKDGIPGPFQGKALITLCPGGVRNARAARHLAGLGVAEVYYVRDGMIAWTADADNPRGTEFNAVIGRDGRPMGLPERPSTFIEQTALVVSSFVFKPAYTLASILLAAFLWRKKVRAPDLRALGIGLAMFAIGEVGCFINYNMFDARSYAFNYLHSWGMVLSFAFTTFAVFEALDHRLIRFSPAQERCSFLALCRQCYKTSDVACRLFRTFLFLAAAAAALTLIPLTAAPHPVSYNTRIFGTFFNFSSTRPFQLFEILYCPLVAALLFAAAGLVLLFRQRRPSTAAKVLFAGGAGHLGFSFFRLFLFAPYRENLVWNFFWEEATELIFIAGVIVVFWLFRKGLFPRPERPPA